MRSSFRSAEARMLFDAKGSLGEYYISANASGPQEISEGVRCKPEERMDDDKQQKTFRLGDTVRIVSGPFTSFTGKIEGINQSKALLKVKVAIYGRNTPIKLNFGDVEVVPAFLSHS